MNVPFMDLSGSFDQILSEINTKIDRIISNTNFINGDEVQQFEDEFAKYCDVKHAIGCANGTDALILSLKALGVSNGDIVITVPNTFIATVESIKAVGAEVQFVDVDPQNFTMDSSKLKDYLNNHNSIERIKAVIPVHLYGQMADMKKIKEISQNFGLKIIEDSAQAHGAKINGFGPGHYGDLATFSFYPGKNLGAFGDAGAVITNDEILAKEVKMLVNHGRKDEKYLHRRYGYNSRLDTIQAAVLLVKLKYLDEWTSKRIKNAKLYNELLDNVNVVLPNVGEEFHHVYHLYVIKVKEREKLKSHLAENNISTGIHYPIPLHLQPALDDLKLKEGNFPISEKLSKQVLSLPLWPEISKDQINYVVKHLKNGV